MDRSITEPRPPFDPIAEQQATAQAQSVLLERAQQVIDDTRESLKDLKKFVRYTRKSIERSRKLLARVDRTIRWSQEGTVPAQPSHVHETAFEADRTTPGQE